MNGFTMIFMVDVKKESISNNIALRSKSIIPNDREGHRQCLMLYLGSSEISKVLSLYTIYTYICRSLMLSRKLSIDAGFGDAHTVPRYLMYVETS